MKKRKTGIMWRWKSSLSSPSSARLFPNIVHVVDVVVVVVVICIFGQLLSICQAQSTTPTTDPFEVRILNSIFQKWSIDPNRWNKSGGPCTRVATDSTPDKNYNLVECDCSYNNNTTCHITHLMMYEKNVKGNIPNELWSLTYLIHLELCNNLLTGSLSPAIGNLNQMNYIDVGYNALSGELPIEIGQLTKLKHLSLSVNNFSGSLPSEIGNLLNLENIVIDSSGLSGEISKSFANLRSLKRMIAFDNAFTGKIDFIGSWPNLDELMLTGNSFEGPIPLEISKLTSLTKLHINDVTIGASSLEFIMGLTNLTTLVLRNNNISSSIPSNIEEFQALSHLDLSFNNLFGQIPDALFNLTNLTFLSLGNNSLTGTLPLQKNTNLVTIDVSYNNLTGSLPIWDQPGKIYFNPVGNNLTIDNNNIGFLPAGLNCLQRNFPCNNGEGLYNKFSVNCGGPQITSHGIVFERDDETLRPASYYVTSSNRWAVSHVALMMNESLEYELSTSQHTSTLLSSELFKRARISSSSLRYYGLGLQNGNYNVTLHFSEIVIQNMGWESLGRRIFDIYIQGTRVEKDFDIRKEANGSSFKAVERNFSAHVSQNYLEIHLFWAGKGTYWVPYQENRGPLISAISATRDFVPSNKKDQTGMIAGIAVGAGAASLFTLLFLFCIVHQKRKTQAKRDEELPRTEVKPYTFSYGELKAATKDFNPINKLGEGGFGPVFKGILNDGRVIAVKQLSLASRQGKKQFIAEIETISSVQHRNLVKLYGCCIKGDQRLLVYEYLENKSLDQALFGEKSLGLEWTTRYEICLGIAKGLAYLHEDSRLRIVHRDVKASNILLDSKLVPKISDFGLAKLYDDEMTHISTHVAGTIGYLAPEYAMRGHLTKKADVFAFGVVALEIISGRSNSNSSLEEDEMYLLELAWNLHETNREVDLVDTRLLAFKEEEAKRIVRVALLCTQTSPAIRPSMSHVIAMLHGDSEVSNVATKPSYLVDLKFCDQTIVMSERSISKGAEKNSYYTSLSSSITGGSNLSPISFDKQLLHEKISEGQ